MLALCILSHTYTFRSHCTLIIENSEKIKNINLINSRHVSSYLDHYQLSVVILNYQILNF